MKFVCLVHTEDYRGDHSADLVIPVEPEETESVYDFSARVLTKYRAIHPGGANKAWLRIIQLDENK